MSRGAKIAIIVGGIVLAVLIFLPLFLGGFSGWRGGWGMMGPGMMGGYGWGWMPLLVIVFWGLVIWGIVAAVRSTSSRKCSTSTAESAVEVLKRRYALGEIKKKEYEEKKKDLS
jgi:putative membrane protein